MTQTRIRTRFAPSPTGFIHLGNIRSALYPWAFARANGGDFILRIEDTDLERSSQAAVDVILEGMAWLGLDPDEGPFYQMQRMDRYKAVLAELVAAGQVYPCYMGMAELDALRERQMASKEKPRYDGTWRPEPGKALPPVPEGVKPVVRFANPVDGVVTWDDLVKGSISIRNEEIDDLIILRPDGVPTYNFAVVVDDLDMGITHVFRGDEHINNTPWQINIFRALLSASGGTLPAYGHCPIILGDDGLKLSKRRGAVSVTAYKDAGYLPEAMLNYLARLGWSHGDEELFTLDQMVQWFDGSHLAKSPAQWDPAKLAWVNAHYIKQAADDRLAGLVQAQLDSRGVQAQDLELLARAAALFKDRCSTVVELADWTEMLFVAVQAKEEERAQHVTEAIKPALRSLRERLSSVGWDKAVIAAAMKDVLAAHQVKMGQLAPAVRVLVCGRAQTPSIDAVLALFTRETVLARLQHV